MRFWDTEDGKILSYAIHEHNSAIGVLKRNTEFFEKYQGTDVLTQERMLSLLEANKTNHKKAQEAMDLIYTHFKQKHEGNNI